MANFKSKLLDSRLHQHISLELLLNVSLVTVLTLVPLLIEGPQLVIGSIINFTLLMLAMNQHKKVSYGTTFIPSIATILRGYIWGPFTPFLIFLMPFIWLGNILMVRSVARKSDYSLIIRMLRGIIRKILVLSASVVILNRVGLVPNVLIMKMSVLQLITAAIGGGVAYFFIKIIDYRNVRYK